MFRLNTDSISSDVIVIDYYDENYFSFPSTEYIEEILDVQKKFFDKVYNEMFLYYEKKPEFIDPTYNLKVPGKATISITNYCFCTLLFLLLVTTLFSTIYFSVCIRNKNKTKIIKVDPFDLEKAESKIIKYEPF